MHLSLHTDFALRTLIYLASSGDRAQIAPIAEFYRISKDHLAKVVRRLAQEGFVRSLRGAGGGIQLARSPELISVGEVIRAFEGETHLLDCIAIENVCVIQPGCRLRHVLARAERIQMDYLNSVPLSSLVKPRQPLVELTLPQKKHKRVTV